ncbi:MAG: antibiotic biosynthesis monooxygenase family protein [Kofleriaceae bacterium]
MVIEYIRYTVPADRHSEFLVAYRSAGELLSVAPGCARYEIAQGVEQPDHFVVRIEWSSVAEHEQGFRKSPGFQPFFELVKPFFAQIQEMKHYRQDHHGTGPGH